MADRVHSSNSRVYVNDVPMTGISDYNISLGLKSEPVRELGNYQISDRIKLSKQTPEITLSWILGEGSSDPFFDFSSSGIISVEKFTIRAKDIVGQQILSGAYLNSYAIKGGVGELVTAAVKYEADDLSFVNTGGLSILDQTSHSYQAFSPQRIVVSSSFENGDMTVLPLQSFSIDIPVPRTQFAKISDMIPSYRIPVLPIDANVSFTAVKNQITGIDLSRILLEKGTFEFELNSCSNKKVYAIEDCSLVSLGESLDLDGNATLDFSYSASIGADTFIPASGPLPFLADFSSTLLKSSDGDYLVGGGELPDGIILFDGLGIYFDGEGIIYL